MEWRLLFSRALTEAYTLGRPAVPVGLRILMYHSVGPRGAFDSYGLCVPDAVFRRQMTALASHPQVTLVSLVEGAGTPADGLRVALTFDDGYRDTLLIAAPILSELGLPFSVFVVPRYVQSGNPCYLTRDELKTLASFPGCTIGSHGMTHLRLVDVDDERLASELTESRRWLEEILVQPVTTIAYPHGAANQRVREAAMRAGYTLGVCSRTGVNDPRRDPLMLCRTEIRAGDGLRLFTQKVLGGWDWHRFRHRDPVAR